MSGEAQDERQAAPQGDSRDAGIMTSSLRYGRLRPGPGLSREVVESHQRSRLQQAMIELAATDGYEALTVRRLAKRARISSGTFYRHYRSTDECLLSSFDQICQCVSQRLIEVAQNEPEPRRRLELAIDRLFQDLAAAPQVATFMLRAAPAVGPVFTSGMQSSEGRLGAALELCMRDENSQPLDPLLLEGIVAGLTRIGRVSLPKAQEDEISGLAAEAAEWIVGLDVPSWQQNGPKTVISPERGNGLPVSGPLRHIDWGGALGDERAMILAAAFRIARSDYHQLSVPRICREAGVSRREFNRHFRGAEDCFIAALEERVAGALAVVRGQPRSDSWTYAVYQALETLCGAIEADRDGARVLFVEITAAGTEGIDSRDRLISQAARELLGAAPEGRGPSALAAEASIAAAWAVLRRQVQDRSSAMATLPVLALLLLGRESGGPETSRTKRVELGGSVR